MADELPNHCPICERQFATQRALHEHLVRTQRHPSAVQTIYDLKAQLAEAQRAIEIYRDLARNKPERLNASSE